MEAVLRTTELTPRFWKFQYKGVTTTTVTTQLQYIQDIIEEQFGIEVPVSSASASDEDEDADTPATLTLIVPASCRDGLMIFKKQNSLQLRSLRAL